MRGLTAAASVLCLALVTARKPRPTPAPAEDTTTAAATTEAVDGGDTADDEEVARVKSYIDAGSCGSVATGSSCGDSAQSYYAEFEVRNNSGYHIGKNIGRLGWTGNTKGSCVSGQT